MWNVIVKEYTIDGKTYCVYGCGDKDTTPGEFDFFDVLDEDGNTLNEGDPYYHVPCEDEVADLIKSGQGCKYGAN